jgi:hypothetical protein
LTKLNAHPINGHAMSPEAILSKIAETEQRMAKGARRTEHSFSLDGNLADVPAPTPACTCRIGGKYHERECPRWEPQAAPQPPSAPRKALARGKATKTRPEGSQAGRWVAVADHTGASIEVPGFEKQDGYRARVDGARLLSASLGVVIKIEWVRVEWVER